MLENFEERSNSRAENENEKPLVNEALLRHIRVEDECGVVHLGLEGAVDVGEAGGGAAEAHALAEVVAPRVAVLAGATADACLDGDALADLEVGDARRDGGDIACCFVAQHKRRTDSKVAVPAVAVVVH